MESIEKICILCFSTGKETINLFNNRGHSLNIAKILTEHFWFQVDSDNAFPNEICIECWNKTESFHIFYRSVQVVHKEFEKKSVKLEHHLNDDEAGYHLENNKDYRCTDTSQTQQSNEIKRDDDENPLHLMDDQFERIEFEVTPDIIIESNKRQRNRKRSKRKKVITKTVVNDDIDLRYDSDGDNKQDDSKCTVEMEQKILEYFDMMCDLCSYKFNTLSQAKMHYQHLHDKQKGYLKCCNKKFYLKSRIIDHVNWHLNPNVFTCKICAKNFGEKRTLTAHLLRHMANENRNFICDQCNKRFSRKHLLNRHVIDVHPIGDQKFVCEFCQKNFKLEQTLKTHILNVHHRINEQICDICAKIFKSKEGFQDHMLSHMDTEEPRIQCNYCGVWLKNKGSLNKHIKTHTDTPQMCDICHKIKPNRSALNHHKRIVHSEATHHCTICDKTFKRLLALTEHIASHTGENLYTCPYCPKMFKSNSNMHKHRKQAHHEQWTQDREKKHAIYTNPTAS